MKKFIPAAVIFCVALSIGFWIASLKPLWNDELFTVVSSVHHQSYRDMFLGRIPEGNNSPLFYSLQKMIIGLTHYQVPPTWIAGDWGKPDIDGQFLLRVNPVVFMTLSIAMVFYFFYRQYSLLAGLLSVLIYASSYMLWVYWAEARPYGLYVFLTTAQSLIVAHRVITKDESARLLCVLCVVHLLLAMTSIFSIGQITAATALLLLLGKRDWKWFLGLTVLPIAIILFYYAHAPRYSFYYDLTPEQLIRDNISRERFYIIGIFAVAWLWLRQKAKQHFIAIIPYAQFFGMLMLMTALFLMMFAISAKAKGVGFPVSNRYFIYLMPVGIILTTWMTVMLWRALSAWRIVQVGYGILIAALLLPKFFKIVPRAISSIVGGS